MTNQRSYSGRFVSDTSLVRRLSLVLAFLASGCATIQQLGFEEPTFDVTSVRIDGLGLTGGSLTLLVDVENPNAYALRTGQIDLAIDFEGTRFGEAFLDGATRFDSKTITPIEVPLSFNWAGLGAGARGLLASGAIGYTLATKLTVDTPIGDRPIAMTTRGNVPVRRMIP